jgi:hypothetical protein
MVGVGSRNRRQGKKRKRQHQMSKLGQFTPFGQSLVAHRTVMCSRLECSQTEPKPPGLVNAQRRPHVLQISSGVFKYNSSSLKLHLQV